MQISSKQKLLRLVAGSMFVAGTVFGTAAMASAEGEGGGGEGPGIPAPALPNIPTDPSEGLPVPIPGGGAETFSPQSVPTGPAPSDNYTIKSPWR